MRAIVQRRCNPANLDSQLCRAKIETSAQEGTSGGHTLKRRGLTLLSPAVKSVPGRLRRRKLTRIFFTAGEIPVCVGSFWVRQQKTNAIVNPPIAPEYQVRLDAIDKRRNAKGKEESIFVHLNEATWSTGTTTPIATSSPRSAPRRRRLCRPARRSWKRISARRPSSGWRWPEQPCQRSAASPGTRCRARTRS